MNSINNREVLPFAAQLALALPQNGCHVTRFEIFSLAGEEHGLDRKPKQGLALLCGLFFASREQWRSFISEGGACPTERFGILRD